MKTNLLHLTTCVVLVAGGIEARADKVPPGQVPKAVLKAISEQSQTRGEPARDIDRQTKDGKAVYEVEFNREGLNRKVKFNEDGTMVPEDRGLAELTTPPALDALPAPVQKTVNEQRAGRAIADIDQETWNGHPVYEVEFKEDGPNRRIHIAVDGSIVMNNGALNNHGARVGYLGTLLSDTPQAVQDRVKQVAGDGAAIADVDRKTKDGATVYNVEIRQEGLNRHLQITEAGVLLRDSKMPNAAADIGDRASGAIERVREKVTAPDTAAMSFSQLPEAVQKTVAAHGDVAQLKPVKQTQQKDGTLCYSVEFEKRGLNTRLKVGQDGQVIR